MSVNSNYENNINVISQFPNHSGAQIKIVDGILRRTDERCRTWLYGWAFGTTLKNTVLEISKTCQVALDHLEKALPTIDPQTLKAKKIEQILKYSDEVERVTKLQNGLNNILTVYKKRKENDPRASKEGITELEEIAKRVDHVLKEHQKKFQDLEKKHDCKNIKKEKELNFNKNGIYKSANEIIDLNTENKENREYQLGDITKGILESASNTVTELVKSIQEYYYPSLEMIPTQEILKTTEAANLKTDDNLVKQVIHDTERSQGFFFRVKNQLSDLQKWKFNKDMNLQEFLEKNLHFLPFEERKNAALLATQGAEADTFVKLTETLKDELKSHILAGIPPQPIYEFERKNGQNFMTMIREYGLRNQKNAKIDRRLQARTMYNLTNPEKNATLMYTWED